MNEQDKTSLHEVIKKCVEVLRAGGVILYPTDTVWGIGCDATQSEAVRKIYTLKQRADSKAMLVLTDAPGRIDYYFDRVPEIAWDLWEVADKPLTLILPRARRVAPELVAADGTLGIRITHETFSQQLCTRFGKPIVSTSANISGQPTPRRFVDIAPEILSGVDYVVPLRQDETDNPAPSGIIKVGDGGLVTVIR